MGAFCLRFWMRGARIGEAFKGCELIRLLFIGLGFLKGKEAYILS